MEPESSLPYSQVRALSWANSIQSPRPPPISLNIYYRKINNKINVFVLDHSACDLILIKWVCIKSVSFHAY